MDVNPFHSFYGVQKIFHHFFGQPETKVAYLFVGIYLYTQHCYFITSNYSLSITIYSARKDSPFCINSEYWRNFSTLIFRSTYHLVNLLKIHYYVSTRSDTNDLVHPRFPWKTESKDELPTTSRWYKFLRNETKGIEPGAIQNIGSCVKSAESTRLRKWWNPHTGWNNPRPVTVIR